MRASFVLALMIVSPGIAGCSALRGIEQWKCDNMGMCHFGLRPSAPDCPCSPSVPGPAVVNPEPPCCHSTSPGFAVPPHQLAPEVELTLPM